ncbi:unnamed protein product [Arabidopsis arenosa]|uniref:PGG domain-containing protein n=1 Tax=Arabidopsis arenosa TaxID=38785 RepID=A0A8S2AB73_ARAAE|nr:unnamed protein product [Arabidopsis arenosa]
MAASRFVEVNPSMLEETYEGSDLHVATRLGYVVLAKKIIELYPSQIRSTNSKGDTPLHIAASLGHTSILVMMLMSTQLHNPCEIQTQNGLKPAEMMNNDGLTPLHCAAKNGSVKILREFLDKAPSSFNLVTRGNKETVFHIAAKHKNNEAFIFMANNAKLGQLLHELDANGNTVLHVAVSVGSVVLVNYLINETKIDVITQNKRGFAAVDLLKENDDNYLPLYTAMCNSKTTKHPSSIKEVMNFEAQVFSELKKMQNQIVRVQSRESKNNEFEMQSEALQNSRNTITIVAVLIASVTFTCGINPPGGLYQDGPYMGKSTAGRTLAFKIFSISNTIALFTSVCMVILLVSVMPCRTNSLKKLLILTYRMMWVAIAAMAIAYVAATWVTLPHLEETKWLVYATLAIASMTVVVADLET